MRTNKDSGKSLRYPIRGAQLAVTKEQRASRRASGQGVDGSKRHPLPGSSEPSERMRTPLTLETSMLEWYSEEARRLYGKGHRRNELIERVLRDWMAEQIQIAEHEYEDD